MNWKTLSVLRKIYGGVYQLVWRMSLARRRYLRRLGTEQLADAEFDREHRVATGGIHELVEVGVPEDAAKRGTIYQPVWSSVFHRAVGALSIDYQLFTFLDLGSGKGKALLLASDYPFRRIIGVEYSGQLLAVAQKNLRTYSNPSLRCQEMTCIFGDALEFDLPLTPLVCFLYNPFERATLKRVVRRLVESIESSPRPAIIVFVKLMQVHAMARLFREFSELTLVDSGECHLTYRVIVNST